jgi:hypothetical protein
VEFAVASDAPTLLRGRINSHDTPGSWIEFAAEGLPRLVLGGSEKPRAHVRAAVDVTVVIKRSDATKMVCRITDVSERGTRISGLPCALEPGEEVSLSLLGGPAAQSNLGTARIVWARAKEAGANLVGSLAPAFARVVQQALALRGSALEMSHPAGCRCRAGMAPNDPRTPRAIGRERLT